MKWGHILQYSTLVTLCEIHAHVHAAIQSGEDEICANAGGVLCQHLHLLPISGCCIVDRLGTWPLVKRFVSQTLHSSHTPH